MATIASVGAAPLSGPACDEADQQIASTPTIPDSANALRRDLKNVGSLPADASIVLLGDSLVEAWPSTGRRHQIRRHLKHLSHPILGDATHGKGPVNRWWAQRLGLQRLWLHAAELALPHPISGDWLTLGSGLSLDLGRPRPSVSADHPGADWRQRIAPLPWSLCDIPAKCAPANMPGSNPFPRPTSP